MARNIKDTRIYKTGAFWRLDTYDDMTDQAKHLEKWGYEVRVDIIKNTVTITDDTRAR